MSAAAAAAPAAAERNPGSHQHENDESRWRPALELPCHLTVDLPLPGFRVSDFLALRQGSVVPSKWGIARDVPVRINGTLIAWGELEGVGDRLAVRMTEVA